MRETMGSQEQPQESTNIPEEEIMSSSENTQEDESNLINSLNENINNHQLQMAQAETALLANARDFEDIQAELSQAENFGQIKKIINEIDDSKLTALAPKLGFENGKELKDNAIMRVDDAKKARLRIKLSPIPGLGEAVDNVLRQEVKMDLISIDKYNKGTDAHLVFSAIITSIDPELFKGDDKGKAQEIAQTFIQSIKDNPELLKKLKEFEEMSKRKGLMLSKDGQVQEARDEDLDDDDEIQEAVKKNEEPKSEGEQSKDEESEPEEGELKETLKLMTEQENLRDELLGAKNYEELNKIIIVNGTETLKDMELKGVKVEPDPETLVSQALGLIKATAINSSVIYYPENKLFREIWFPKLDKAIETVKKKEEAAEEEE